MQKKTDSGFGVVEVLVAIVVVGLMVTVGWLYYSNSKEQAEDSAAQHTQQTSKEQPKQKVADTLELADSEIGVKFSYPKNWVTLKCDHRPKSLYLASDDRGIGKSESQKSILCSDNDFPPQVSFKLEESGFTPGSNLMPPQELKIDDHVAYKYTYISDDNGLHAAGTETTWYTVEKGDGILVITYHKAATDEYFDNSEASKAAFTKMVESSLDIL